MTITMYVLDGHDVRPASSAAEWAQWYETHDAERHVGRDVIGDATVSTVFLGLDHRFFGEGPSLLFETMVFGGENDKFQARCSTWDQAEHQHATTVAAVKAASAKGVTP